MKKLRVLHFTAIWLGSEDTGGFLACREHARQIASIENADVTICTIGDPAQNDFIQSLGVEHHNILYRRPTKSLRGARDVSGWLYPFLWETTAREQRHIDQEVFLLAEIVKPDIVIIDYLPSAIFAPSLLSVPAKRIVVTHNREAELHRIARLGNRLHETVSPALMAEQRFAAFERLVHRQSDGIVALTSDDLPQDLPKHVPTTVIEPLLTEREDRWTGDKTKQLFFVGNVSHPPNHHAIDWLATKLAPELARIDPEITIKVVGADADSAPSTWLRDNVDLLGRGDRQLVEELFVHSAFLIVPSDQQVGSKIKILEAVAHGAPVVASPQALAGLPFPEMVPQFDWDDPAGAARLVAKLTSDPDALSDLASELTDALRRSRRTTGARWSRFIDEVSALRRVPTPADPLQVRLRNTFLGLPDTSRPTHAGAANIGDDLFVTSNAKSVVEGAHYPETTTSSITRRKTPVRWTSGDTEIRFVADPNKHPQGIYLHATNVQPGGRIDISINDEPVLVGDVDAGPLAVTLLLPKNQSWGSYVLRIKGSTVQPEGDARHLGILVDKLKLVS